MNWHGQINRTIWEIQEFVRKKPEDRRMRRELLRAHFLQHFEFDRAFHVPRDDRSFLFLHEKQTPACLLLHGARGTPAEMRELGNFLYSKDFTVFCPRFSRTDTKDRMVSWESWVTQAQTALETVLAYSRDTYVIGLSLGGTMYVLAYVCIMVMLDRQGISLAGAMTRLAIVVPIVIASVYVLLWLSFNSMQDALIVMINVPLALIGGVLGLYLTGEYLSVPASVGFIALFGIAVQNGVVLVSYFRQHRTEGKSLRDAIIHGALLRLRPVLMTALTTVLGLLPLLLSQGIGSEVQRPLAVVVVFGLTTSTLLTLYILPAVYSWTGDAGGRSPAGSAG